MADARALIRDALQACRVEPPRGFVWFGRRFRVAHDGSPDKEWARGTFLRALTRHLYGHFYCRGGAVPLGRASAISGVGEVRAFMTALSAANRHRDRWDDGWTIVERKADQCIVRKWDTDFTVTADGCRSTGNEPLLAGSSVDVLVPSERWFEYPGYMLFHGRRIPEPRAGSAGLTRLYLNLDHDGACRMIDLCGTLDDLPLPYALKVAGRPEGLDRCDTVILFIGREDYRRASEVLVETGRDLREMLRPGSPAFTRPIARGVGVADDPGGGESFGESRCRLLAEGIVIAGERGETGVEARLRTIEDRFRQAGTSLDRPHLNPGSTDYETGPWDRWPGREGRR
ncbi:MAG TPA: T3SS effector HopA1 family protein [Gemmatimonadota bacterium]|nr:T3SS effector HopA1 family protein [Gemmatimonadota bacterium]